MTDHIPPEDMRPPACGALLCIAGLVVLFTGIAIAVIAA